MPVAAAAIGAVASIGGGIMASRDAKKAQNAQTQATRDTNEANYRMFRESRGADGSAILPLYLPAGTESRMADQAVQVFDAITGQPVTMTLAEYQAIVDAAKPAIAAGDQLVDSIFSGELERERQARERPVADARTGVAASQAQAINTAVQQQLNDIRAQEAAKGYVGGGSFSGNRLLDATIQARQAAAGGRAMANLENELAKQRISDQSTDLALRSLDVPAARAGSKINLAQLPATGVANLSKIGQSSLDFFRLPVGNPPRQETPRIEAIPSSGTLLTTGLGQIAGSLGNYYAQKELADQWAQMTPYGGWNVPIR